MKEWPLSSLQRWAPSKTGFVLDFGTGTKQRYFPIETVEGEQIAQLAADCVELMKSRKTVLVQADEFEFPSPKKPLEVLLSNISLGLASFSFSPHSLNEFISPSYIFLSILQKQEKIDSARRVVRSQVSSCLSNVAALIRCFPSEKLASPETLELPTVSTYISSVIVSVIRLRRVLSMVASTLTDPNETILDEGKEILTQLREFLVVATNLLKHILFILGLSNFFSFFLSFFPFPFERLLGF